MLPACTPGQHVAQTRLKSHEQFVVTFANSNSNCLLVVGVSKHYSNIPEHSFIHYTLIK